MRRNNFHANSLATLATSLGQGLPRVILMEDLLAPAEVDLVRVGVHQTLVGPSWMDPLVAFLKEGMPRGERLLIKIQRKAPRFWLSKKQKLYKHSFSEMLLQRSLWV